MHILQLLSICFHVVITDRHIVYVLLKKIHLQKHCLSTHTLKKMQKCRTIYLNINNSRNDLCFYCGKNNMIQTFTNKQNLRDRLANNSHYLQISIHCIQKLFQKLLCQIKLKSLNVMVSDMLCFQLNVNVMVSEVVCIICTIYSLLQFFLAFVSNSYKPDARSISHDGGKLCVLFQHCFPLIVIGIFSKLSFINLSEFQNFTE